MDVVVFRLGPQHFGIPVTQVGQVFPVAEIAPLTDARVPVRGTVDIHGDLTPVIDLGRRIANSWTPLHLEQQMILVESPTQRMVLLADEVEGVRSVPDHAPGSTGLIFVDDKLVSDLRTR